MTGSPLLGQHEIGRAEEGFTNIKQQAKAIGGGIGSAGGNTQVRRARGWLWTRLQGRQQTPLESRGGNAHTLRYARGD